MLDPTDPRWLPEITAPRLPSQPPEFLSIYGDQDEDDEANLTPEQFAAACRIIARYLAEVLDAVPWYRRARTVVRAIRDLLGVLADARRELKS